MGQRSNEMGLETSPPFRKLHKSLTPKQIYMVLTKMIICTLNPDFESVILYGIHSPVLKIKYYRDFWQKRGLILKIFKATTSINSGLKYGFCVHVDLMGSVALTLSLSHTTTTTGNGF